MERISFSDMLDLISVCGELEAKIQSTEYKTKNTQVNWTTLTKGIIPGTLWCGVDDIAGDYYRLGTLWRVDKCCRAHDFCPVKVKPFKAKYKVFNFAPYTKSHCDCDEIFYDCLKQVNSSKADAVGDVFFNVLGIKCIEERLGKSCNKNTNFKTRAENESSQTPGQGFDVKINNGPSPPENCKHLRLFVINAKRKY